MDTQTDIPELPVTLPPSQAIRLQLAQTLKKANILRQLVRVAQRAERDDVALQAQRTGDATEGAA